MARKKSDVRPHTKTAASSSASRWPGIIAIVVGFILLAYLVFGGILFFADLTGGFAKFWTSIFFYPATTVMTEGYLGWALLGVLLPLLAAAALGKIIWYGLKGKAFTSRSLALVGGALVIVALAQFWVPPISNAVIGYHEYIARTEALNNLQQQQQQQFQQQQQPDESMVRSSALQQLVQGDIIRQVAVKLDVTVSGKEVDDFYQQMAEQNQGEDNLKKQLKDLLGWTPAQFKQEIRLRLLQEKIGEKLSNDEELNAESKQKAEDLLKQIQEGRDFAEVAKEAGGDAFSLNQDSAGEPVTVKKGETDPAIEDFAFKANEGNVSGVIKTQTGFAIVKVTAKPNPDEVQIQQVVVPGISINEYFTQQLQNATIIVSVHGLVWNNELFTVQPKDGQQSQNGGEPTATDTPAAAGAPATEAPAAPVVAQ